jgi:hypothetical protein
MASFTLGDILGTIFGTSNKPPRTPAMGCSCPACTGLACLERPRFFAGQLLSETDFNSEIDYALAKQRLHNRYLHGPGTVCGLEVVCSNCEGQVIIKPGYAIDPCGNDIIVCQEQPLDVLKAIKACCDTRKKKSKTGCDPYQPASDPGCSDALQHWCITLEYQETPTQPITPLRGKQKTCSCNSCSGSCGCGCGNSKGSATQSNGCSNRNGASNTATTPVSCEPTRILESYRLGVVEEPDACLNPITNLQQSLKGTLLFNLIECVADVFAFVTKLPSASAQIIGLGLTGELANSQSSNAEAYAACCQFRQFAIDLFSSREIASKCAALKKFDEISCPPAPKDQQGRAAAGNSQYLEQVQRSIDKTFAVLFEYIPECGCYQLLPPCSPDPHDDRLILACVTIQDGEIIDICNLGCRQFAGGFPSFFYWLSLVPIIPLLKSLITQACCGGIKTADPTQVLKRAVTEGNFALPRMLFERFGDLAQNFSLEGMVSKIPANNLNLATLRGMKVESAKNTLASFNIASHVQQVKSRAEIPLLPDGLMSPIKSLLPFAAHGDRVVLYNLEGTSTVAEVRQSAFAAPQDMTELSNQVAAMKADIARLKAKK